MMKKIIHWLFKHHRNEMEDAFIEDLFGDVPRPVLENSLKFLLTGKAQLDKFFRWECYALQRKMQQPLKHAESYVGGLVFIQALTTMMARLDNGTKLFPSDEKQAAMNDVIKDMEGVSAFETKGRTKEQS